MIKKVSKFLLLFLSLFGIIFSNIPFYAVSSAFNAYVKSYNIVDKAWHLQKDSNVVDKFASFRNLTEELKIKETYAATSGAVYPTLGVTVAESPWLDNNWTNPTNVYSDDAATAYVIAASFDSPDQTYVLKATGFDFSAIPDGSTINGVTARVNAWYRSGQGSGAMDLCQLLDINKAKVGTNQCATQVALTTNNTTIITKGSASDKWGNALDTAWVKDPDFGIAIGIKATAANADVDVDYVTLEIDYTPPVGTTTLSTGTNPGDSTIAPGGAITSVNGFTLTTNTGTDAITSITVNLSTNSGVGTLTITDGADAVLGSIGGGTGAGIVTGSNAISITSINATTGGTAFKVKVTPLSHSNMPVPDGGAYAITGIITDWAGTNTKAGQANDTSSTVTIDNDSPAGTTGSGATSGENTQSTVSWTNPGDADFQQVYIYCKTSSLLSGEAPAEGTDPAVDATACDATARMKYKGAASPQIITGLTNGTLYYFRIYGRDTNGNFTAYSATQEASGTPSAPAYTLTVGVTGTQTSVVDSGTTTAAYLGGAFTFVLDSGSATLDSFVVSETGSTNASTSLISVDIQTDTDGAYPGSTVTGCTGLTFNASQKLTICTPSGGLSLSSATTRYIYVVVNTISSGAAGGETIEIEITNAATEVTVTGATNGSSGTKAIGGTTTIRPYISSITYPRTSPQNGGEIGQSVTINGAGFGTSCNGASNKVEIGSAIVSCTGTTFSATSISITNFQYSSGDSYGGTGASGLLVTVGNATSSARQTFYVYPSVTSVSVSEAREGDTIATISGNHFGTAEWTKGVMFDDGIERTATVNGTWSATSITNVVVPGTISGSVDTVALRVYQGIGGLNTLSSSTSFVLLPDITGIIDDFGGADDTAREYDADDNAANNTTADLKDGEIEIGGKHFGGAGTVTILGQTAAQAVVGARCGGSSYTATCITARVSTTTSDSLYTGNVVVQRTSDSKNDSLSGFRILPRITGFTPTNAPVGDPVTVDGNHFCQNGGACPGAFDAANNYVIFNSNATATAFTSWSDTAMATVVPIGASTGNVFLRSNGYNSNAKSFTVNVPTPTDPSNLKQSRNSGFTNLITIGEYASSTPIYFSVDTSSGITGGTMYLQTELRLTGSAFTSSCSGNPYCFENGGSAYSGGTITLTTSTTTPTTTLDDNYHWQARVCYNKNGTHNISCTGTGDNPSNNWISFGTDPDDVNEVDFKLDITAPTISIGSVTPGQNGATIPWDTNELATSQLEYGTDSGLSGSSFTAVTDTPPATSGKTSGHSVTLSNLNCNTTYYFRIISKNKAYIEGTSTISNFPTSGCPTQPGKTTSFHIKGATGIISGGTTSTTTFAVIMPETAATTTSAFVEVMGVYLAGASLKDIGIQVNSQSARTYVVPASTTSFFKFIYQVDSVNPSNTLVITPQTNTSVYISSARIIVTYAYTP